MGPEALREIPDGADGQPPYLYPEYRSTEARAPLTGASRPSNRAQRATGQGSLA